MLDHVTAGGYSPNLGRAIALAQLCKLLGYVAG